LLNPLTSIIAPPRDRLILTLRGYPTARALHAPLALTRVEPILLERHSAAGRANDAGCTVILPAHTSLVEFWSMVPARMFLPGALEAHR
jgi:hypothetical protein